MVKFLQHVEERAWTDAEKELDTIRQDSENSDWSKGYVKALEGLLLTYRNNDDKYIYLPRALVGGSQETIVTLRKDFEQFAINELHGEYDRGYFRALQDYLSMLSTSKKPPSDSQPDQITSEADSAQNQPSDRRE